MIKLTDILVEVIQDSIASDEAKRLGLQSIGFGRYVNPNNPGTVVAKSRGGRLMAVSGDPVGSKRGERMAMATTPDELQNVLGHHVKAGRIDRKTAQMLVKRVGHEMKSGVSQKDAMVSALRDAASVMRYYGQAFDPKQQAKSKSQRQSTVYGGDTAPLPPTLSMARG